MGTQVEAAGHLAHNPERVDVGHALRLDEHGIFVVGTVVAQEFLPERRQVAVGAVLEAPDFLLRFAVDFACLLTDMPRHAKQFLELPAQQRLLVEQADHVQLLQLFPDFI